MFNGNHSFVHMARAGFNCVLSTQVATVLLLWILSLPGASGAQAQALWLRVDTSELTLSVMRGEDVQVVYDNIAIGSNGATWNKRSGDEKTPLGDFRINEIRPSERFQQFISLDYPTLEHAQRAYSSKDLVESDFLRIRRAHASGQMPPHTTPLGGLIGIHGIGAGSHEIHQHVNWTDGCIALTNEQLQALSGQVKVGTSVLVR